MRTLRPYLRILGAALTILLLPVAEFNSAYGTPGEVTKPAVHTPIVFEAIIDGHMISPATADYLLRAIAKAEEAAADALLIRLNTPGGMLQSTREIVGGMMNARIPIIVWVAPAGAHAGSAGVFITMAGHIAAMAPGTNIGAAHPVTGQGGDIKDQGGSDLAKKVEEDTRAFVESIAQERGRNEVWAARAVTESVSVTASQALELNVVDLIASSREQLLNEIDGREVKVGDEIRRLHTADAEVRPVAMSVRQKLVDFLANPNVAYLLLTLGFLGIYFELSNPGAIFPGVIGGLALVLAFVAMQVLPFNAGGLALLIIAVGMFVAELFVTSYGLLTVGGLICLVLGSLLLFETSEASMRVDLGIIIGVAAAVGVTVMAAGYLVARTFGAQVTTGREGMIGKIGEARTDITDSGTVFVFGELWSASAKKPIAKGQTVRVLALEGLKLIVEPVEGEERA